MEKLEFRFGKIGKYIPLIVAALIIIKAAISQSNVNGYVVAFFAAVVVGALFSKDDQAYGDAIIYGLSRPIFSVIVLAVILAAISGKLISASGMVQTIASYVVNLGFTGRLFAAASFLITCLLAFATGTSVGTYFVVIPILFPVGVMAGVSPEYMIGAIVSGAAFGDNLGPISDTTIASSTTQHADLGTVVKTRTRYSIPAAVSALILFLIFTKTTDANSVSLDAVTADVKPVSLVMLFVPLTIIILCVMRKHLVVALSSGIVVGVILGLITGIYSVADLLSFPGGFSVEGIIISSITGTVGTVCMLIGVFSLIGVMERSGIFSDIGSLLNRFAKSRRSTEATIVIGMGLLSMLTGVISVAIVALGDIVNDIGKKNNINEYRRANLLDCAGCVFCFLSPFTVHCVIPAQQSAAISEAIAVTPASIPFVNFYSISMLAILVIAIITGYGASGTKK